MAMKSSKSCCRDKCSLPPRFCDEHLLHRHPGQEDSHAQARSHYLCCFLIWVFLAKLDINITSSQDEARH